MKNTLTREDQIMFGNEMDGHDRFSSMTRRTFVLSLLAAISAACAGPTVSGSMKREKELLDDTANLYGRISVDLHTHAGPFTGSFPFPDSARDRAVILSHMQAGKLDAAFFSLTTDRPVIQGDPQRGGRQYREPEPGELFRDVQSRYEKASVVSHKRLELFFSYGYVAMCSPAESFPKFVCSGQVSPG